MKQFIIVASLSIFLGFSNSAGANLINNGDGTITQIRNDGSMLMWLQDGNSSFTSGYAETHGLGDGRMNWYEAAEWISYLNASNYLGYHDWRLPYTLPVNGVAYDYKLSFDGSTDYGYYNSSPNSELGYLYYVDFDGVGYHAIDGTYPQPNWGPSSTDPFINIQLIQDGNISWHGYYWSGSTHSQPESSDTDMAWVFSLDSGHQDGSPKGSVSIYAIAVRDLTPGPEPVNIDIKPRSDRNRINIKKPRKIPVAILSNEVFYAPDEVDWNSLTFGRTGDEASLASCRSRPRDVNKDGWKDLVCKFYTELTGFQCGDVEGMLRGQLMNGTPIEGWDSVRVVPCR